MKILLLEDEIPAYQKLKNILDEIYHMGYECDHFRSVEEGVQALHQQKPYDLILSDIQLLDGNAFEIFDRASSSAPIIFCTAHDEHLLRAFEGNGIAYVLKPYSSVDIKNAINKYHNFFEANRDRKAIFKKFCALMNEPSKSYKKRFTIKRSSGIQLLNTNEVSFIKAFGDFCRIIDSKGEAHLLSQNMGRLIQELDPETFFRVSRSFIININFIDKIHAYSKNRLAIQMKNNSESIITSSAVTSDFRKWLDR